MHNSNEVDWLLVILVITAILMVIAVTILCGMWVVEITGGSDQYDEPVDNMEISPINKNINSKNYSYYKITSEERYLLAKLVHSEASICSLECKKAVCSVVFNRLAAGKWGDSLYEVIYYPNAFTPATNGAIDNYEPTKSDYEAVDYIVKNGPTIPTQVRYFRTSHDFSWEGYENYSIIDNVYFGYFTDWQKGVW